MGHAGELETAMLLHLRPDLTHIDRVVDETDFINSSNEDGLDLSGMSVAAAKSAVNEWLTARNLGEFKVTFRLRDWLFSRQRYWGEPFPVLHRDDGSVELVPDEQLPVTLPNLTNFKPTGKAEPPLARATQWVDTTSADGDPVKRETDTMPNWAGSCWYYLRFMDNKNDRVLVDKEIEDYWGPVDLYIGGTEHAVLHLLYARFWHKVLHDLGVVSTKEPFQRLYNQGMILSFAYEDQRGATIAADMAEEAGEDTFKHKDTGEPLTRVVAKMSKTLKNVVNPDGVIKEHGADTLRLYEMYMGPLADAKPWNTKDVPGVSRFLGRVWRLIEPTCDADADADPDPDLEKALHRCIHKVSGDIEKLAFNTAIAAMMIFTNEATKKRDKLTHSQALRFVQVLNPFAPHITEELWSRLGGDGSLAYQPWPEVDTALLKDDTAEMVVQVNGKVRGRITVDTNADEASVLVDAKKEIADQITGKTILKEIVVKGRLVNLVVK